MMVVLAVVALVTVLVAFAITQSGRERTGTAKSVHTMKLGDVTESSLQYARAFFAQLPYSQWNTYLAVSYPPARATYPELYPPLREAANTNYTCYIYARDDEDEFPPLASNPNVDNNLRIFVGAVCSEPTAGGPPITAELSAPLEYNPPPGTN